MENKEQLNQNPEEVNLPLQEENAETVPETVENNTKTESPDAKLSESDSEIQGELKNEEIPSTPDDESYDFGTDEHDDVDEEDTDDDEEDDEEEDEEEEVELSEDAFRAQYENFKLTDILTALEVIVEEENLKDIRSKVLVMRQLIDQKFADQDKLDFEQYLAAGGIEAEYSAEDTDAHIQYKKVLSILRAKRGKLRAQQEMHQTENLEKKQELLEELRTLVNSDETLKSTYDQFKEIQERWKEIGMIPKSEMGELWRNYHFLVEKFFDKVKISNELRDLDLKKNFELKVELCEKAESLLLEKSITKSFKLLQKYHEKWKIIGPAPSNQKEEIWERFKTITDKINLRRRDYYKQLQDKLEENYEAKLALIEKAKEINYQDNVSIKDWNKTTDAFNELFKIWKTIGPTPRKVNDEVWESFKIYLNGFFAAKKKFFGEIKEEQTNNYQKKLAICVEAEGLQNDTNWKNTTETLIKLQKEWKNIGTVPRKYSDVIWKRFRKACDHFFEAKSEHYKDLVKSEGANAKLKSDLIEEIKTAKFSEDKKANLELIKSFQRRWHEIGNVPRKDLEKLSKAYRDAVDMQLDKFDISRVDFRNSGFKEKISNMKENVDNYQLNRERFGVQKTLEKLQEDVLLWENNIGFFANSKNANVLKLEFEAKINKAKAEILSLKEKLKIIDRP